MAKRAVTRELAQYIVNLKYEDLVLSKFSVAKFKLLRVSNS